MARRHLIIVSILVLLAVAAGVLVLRSEQGYALASYVWSRLRGGYTVEERIQRHGAAVESRLAARFAAAGVAYPPSQLAYLAFKDSAQLLVFSRGDTSEAWRLVHAYPILGMSGTAGPKLREGDLQVPEGIYRTEFLNANSRFHLSIRLDYPNSFDRSRAREDGRTNLGSDIMIHGTASSIGCLAMGNQVAEDLFILAALAGKENVQIVVAPTDFRRNPVQLPSSAPPWLPALYKEIQASLNGFPDNVLEDG
jgi:murein L,D-transpeptidase YafK